MAKAEIILPNGTKVAVEGTPEEIVKIKKLLAEEDNRKNKTLFKEKRNKNKRQGKEGPLNRIRILIKDNFFKEKRTIDDIRKELEDKAFFYKPSDLSPSLIRLIKSGELRRLKEKNQWRYMNP